MSTKTNAQPKGNLSLEMKLLIALEFTSRDKKIVSEIFNSNAAKALKEISKAIDRGNSRIAKKIHEPLPANEFASLKAALKLARQLLNILTPNDPTKDLRVLLDAIPIKRDKVGFARAIKSLPSMERDPQTVLERSLGIWIEHSDRKSQTLKEIISKHKAATNAGDASRNGSDGGARKKNIRFEKDQMFVALDAIYETMAFSKTAKAKDNYRRFVSELANRKPTSAQIDKLLHNLFFAGRSPRV